MANCFHLQSPSGRCPSGPMAALSEMLGTLFGVIRSWTQSKLLGESDRCECVQPYPST